MMMAEFHLAPGSQYCTSWLSHTVRTYWDILVAIVNVISKTCAFPTIQNVCFLKGSLDPAALIYTK